MELVIKSVKGFDDQSTTSLLTIYESTNVLTTHNPSEKLESTHPVYHRRNWPNEGHLHAGRQMVSRSHF